MENFISEIENLTFEEALTKLEQIVKRMENSKLSLDEAIKLYEMGNKLKAFCERKLQEANLKVEKIVKDSQGEIKLEDFE